MTTIYNGLVQKTSEGQQPMLEQTSWVKINKQCYTLVDQSFKVFAIITTAYDTTDGDELCIWDVEIEGDEFGSYISLYAAKLAVQEAIAQYDAKVAAQQNRKQKKKTVAKKKTVEKKSVSRK